MAERPPVYQGVHYAVADVGPYEELGRYELDPPLRGRGKLFLQEVLGLTGMEVSVNRLGSGKSVTFKHRHQTHEELYLIVKGSAQFDIDGDIINVSEGGAIRIDPAALRVWRNPSQEPLYYIVVQAKAGSMENQKGEDGIPSDEPVQWPD